MDMDDDDDDPPGPVHVFSPGLVTGSTEWFPSQGNGDESSASFRGNQFGENTPPEKKPKENHRTRPTLFHHVDTSPSERFIESGGSRNDIEVDTTDDEEPPPTTRRHRAARDTEPVTDVGMDVGVDVEEEVGEVSVDHDELKTDVIKFNTVARLFAYSGYMPIELLGRNVTECDLKSNQVKDFDNVIKWAKLTAPKEFWSSFPVEYTEEWTCFYSLYLAATKTAAMFMYLVEKVIHPLEQVSCDGKTYEAVKFLSTILTGYLLKSEFRSTRHQVVEQFVFESFYSCGFRAMQNMVAQLPCDVVTLQCKGCADCANANDQISTLFLETNMALQGLGLMEDLVAPRMYSLIKKQMVVKVEECMAAKYENSYMTELTEWLNAQINSWIDTLYPRLEAEDKEFELTRLRNEFTTMMFTVYGSAIIKDMFSIIIEFPDSQPILEDLTVCMKEENLRNELVVSLKTALERRLLNAGVNTNDVLDAYVATVRALKFVDPTGILVQLITPSVREYLKVREETVRVILVSLTDESGDLSDELSRNPTLFDKKKKLEYWSSWSSWEPDPIDVPRDKLNLRKSDLIETLVSIYGSKSLFIDEYRALLADRLLRMSKPGTITREIKCLELLKLRFGESDLQKCEVMLKDVTDSQRLNSRFYDEEGAPLTTLETQVIGLIVSAQFWPPFKQENLTVPPPISEAFEKFTKAFEMIKGNRTLEWQKHVGIVELEIELGGSTLEFSVTPAQATIIWHFQEKDKWTTEELAEVTGMSASVIKSRLAFWISKNVIYQPNLDTYCLQEAFGDPSQNNVAHVASVARYIEEAEADSPMTSTSSQRENELQMFWSYIEGMLTNLDSLPLGRIHSMLKLFATVECSAVELQKFLDRKVSENLLVFSAGQYQLPK